MPIEPKQFPPTTILLSDKTITEVAYSEVKTHISVVTSPSKSKESSIEPS